MPVPSRASGKCNMFAIITIASEREAIINSYYRRYVTLPRDSSSRYLLVSFIILNRRVIICKIAYRKPYRGDGVDHSGESHRVPTG